MTSNESSSLRTETFCKPFTSQNCGHGVCNEQGNYCHCEPGYIHDYTQFMFPNCYLTNDGLVGIITSLNILAFAIIIAALFVMQGTKGMPRLICWFVIITMVLQACHLVALLLEDKPGIVTEIFVMFLNTAGWCNGPIIFLWTLASPALDLMMLHHQRRVAIKRMIVFNICFFLEHVILFSTALVFQSRGEIVTFNKLVSSQYFFMTFYLIGMYFLIKSYSKMLFTQMDQILKSDMSQDSKHNTNYSKRSAKSNGSPDENATTKRNEKVARHRRKLGYAVKRILPSILISATLMMLFAVTYMAFQAHPYRFVLYFIYMLCCPNFCIIFLVFVYHKQNYSSSLDGSGSQPNKLTAPTTDSQGGNGHHGTGNLVFSSKESDVVSQQQIHSIVPTVGDE